MEYSKVALFFHEKYLGNIKGAKSTALILCGSWPHFNADIDLAYNKCR